MARRKGKANTETSWHICDDCLDPLRTWMLSPEVRRRNLKSHDDFCLTGEEFHDLQFTCNTSLAIVWLQINVSVEVAELLADRLRQIEQKLRDLSSDRSSLAAELDNTGVHLFELSAVLRARIEGREVAQGDLPPRPDPRLIVSLDPPQVTIDETVYSLKDTQALFLGQLAQARDWVSGKDMDFGQRPDRIKKSLPNKVKQTVESKAPYGYRIKRDLLA